MGRTVVTSIRTCKLYGAYRCSKCGKPVQFEKIINATYDASRGGLVYSEKKLSPLRETADRETAQMIGPYVLNELLLTEKGDYSDAYLHCSCNCGNREEWAKFIPSIGILAIERPFLTRVLTGFLFPAMLFSAILFIAGIIYASAKVSIIFGAILAGILLIVFGLPKWFNKLQEKKCVYIPDDSIPHLFILEKDRDDYIENELKSLSFVPATENYASSALMRNNDALDKPMVQDSNPDSISINDDPIFFCRKCGHKVLPDSVFCSKCGTKLR